MRSLTTCRARHTLRQSTTPVALARNQSLRAFTTSRSHHEAPASAPPQTRTSGSKVWSSADEAVADIQSGSVILSAGFGLCGTAETIIHAMVARGIDKLNNLTAVSNNAGSSGDGGLSPLTRSGQISRCIMSYLGNNKKLEERYLTGQIAIELCPQGTLAERIRAAGAGIPAFYTPTGVSTFIQTGEIPTRLGTDEATGKPVVLEGGKVKETRIFNGRQFVMETALPGDVAVLRAWKADEAGNCVFRYTTKAFGRSWRKPQR
jgi:3-oxoacid CoA-transferase